MTSRRLSISSSLLVLLGLLLAIDGLDRFNYYDSSEPNGQGTDYRPQEWGNIACDHNNLEECIGYTSDWKLGKNWKIRENSCKWCPEDGPREAGCDNRHQQSPTSLFRNRAINGTQFSNYCIDIHWMKYEDSTCTFEHLQEAQAFTVERHGLRIAQPLYFQDNHGWLPDCVIEGRGRIWGRIDFSRGFPNWWFLSHMDFHVPSEHTQDGKRYSAELHMYHFYSLPDQTGNELASVSVFLEEYEDAMPWEWLDRIICEWRRDEERTREGCNLPQIKPAYPGCFEPDRDASTQRNGRDRNLRTKQATPPEKRNKKTAFDVILENWSKEDDAYTYGNMTALDDIKPLYVGPENFRPPEERNWDAFIEEQSASMSRKEALYARVHKTGNKTATDEYDVHNRHLLAGESLFWLNYFPMIAVKTEYYYRYEGTMTTPPCYARDQPGTRSNLTNWRVMKDPVRIHPRQLKEMKRLIANRISPVDYPIVSARCQPDTAAKVSVDADGEIDVDVARPIQSNNGQHKMMFCECERWPSKWPEDREWCQEQDQVKRFYQHPYNFKTDGF